MARKEINIFSVSFLDLLSGALAAVIILFVVVPHMTSEQAQQLEEMDDMEAQLQDLRSTITELSGKVDSANYQEALQALKRANEIIEQMEENLEEVRGQQERDQARIAQQQQTIEQQQRELEQLRENVEERNSNSAIGEVMFGVNAQLAITFLWKEDVDIDLWIQNQESGEWCYYRQPNTDFMLLLEDVRSQASDEARYELMYQKELVPGNYKVYLHHYSENSVRAVCEGYVVLFPFTNREKKVNMGSHTLHQHSASPDLDAGVYVGSLVVTNNNIQFNR